MILTENSFKVLRRELFPTLSQVQVDSLNYLVKRCKHFELTYPEAAYVLATAYHETGYAETVNGKRVINRDMLPIKERGSAEYLRSKKYYPYIGYGYVQLTWEDNFRRVGKLIGVDLINHPERLLRKTLLLRF